jgi:hypothetical protein
MPRKIITLTLTRRELITIESLLRVAAAPEFLGMLKGIAAGFNEANPELPTEALTTSEAVSLADRLGDLDNFAIRRTQSSAAHRSVSPAG